MADVCVEFYLYKVRDAAEGARARAEVLDMLQGCDGFRGWRPMVGVDQPTLFVDCVEWDSEAAAKAAGEAFEKDPRTAAFMAGIAERVAMARCHPAADMAA